MGKYSTNWHIYALKDGSWKKIGHLPPSALLFPNATSLTTAISGTTNATEYINAYNALKADYQNVPAIITYEKNIDDGGDYGYRADGRWYYSKTGDKVTSNIIIEYADDPTSTFVTDPFVQNSNVGTTTGASAFFKNTEYYGQTSVTTLLNTSKFFNITTVENTSTGYMFYGWYLKNTDGVYSLMSTDPDYDVPISGSDTFVARYIKIPEGDLVISHNLYSSIADKLKPNIDDPYHTGLGNCYLKVEILNADGSVYRTFGSETSTDSIHLSKTFINYESDKSIKIYIYTDPLGYDKLLKYYVNNYKPLDTQPYCRPMTDFTKNSDGTAYLEFDSFTIKSLFNATTMKNTVSSLEFYSDIDPVVKNYTITYTYETRQFNTQNYVVKGKFDAIYIEEHKNADLTPAMVKANAPFVDDFGKEITWDLDNATIVNGETEATATVKSSKNNHLVTLTLKNANGTTELPITFEYGKLAQYGKVLDNENLKNSGNASDFIFEAKDTDTKTFSYWAVYNTDGDLLTRCYSHFFNYILYDNYVIEAIYDDTEHNRTEDNISTTIDLLEYTRNQWTDANGNKTADYLYADFALAYNFNNQIIETLDKDTVKVGMVFEVCGKLVEESDGSYKTDDIEGKYKDSIATDVNALKNAIKNSATSYSVGGTTRKLYVNQIENTDLSNKNRAEYYLRFKNSTNNQLYVMKVYSYLIDCNTGEVYISEPEYMNLYDIANCIYNIS